MSEETTTTTTDAGAEAPTDDATTTETTVDTTASTAVEEQPPKKVHWWNRSTGGQTYLDRYVFPALVPLISVAIIVFYVINLSRVFLSGKGTIAIVAAVCITVAILVIASAISQATRMRSQSLAVFTAVALLVVAFAGFIAVGHSQEKKEAAAVACKPITATVKVSAEASLHFDKTSYNANAGCVSLQYGGAAGHTLAFDAPGPQSPILDSAGGPGSTFSWTLKPGTYTFYCTVPGHRAAGMQATLTIK